MSEPEVEEELEDLTYRDYLIAIAMHACASNAFGDLGEDSYHVSIAEAAVNIADATLAYSQYDLEEEDECKTTNITVLPQK